MNRETIASDINKYQKINKHYQLKNGIFEFTINNFNTIILRVLQAGKWNESTHIDRGTQPVLFMSLTSFILLHKNDIKINKFLDIGSHYGYWCMLAVHFHNILVRVLN